MPSARERLVDTAEALFYARGITATGVDTVVREAGVSKPTLYAHFRSKDELVAAVLEARHARRVARARRLARSAGGLRRAGRTSTRARARAGAPSSTRPPSWAPGTGPWWPRRPGSRACWRELCGDERLASQLLLLLDGVAGRVVVHGPDAAPGALADARAAADILLAVMSGAWDRPAERAVRLLAGLVLFGLAMARARGGRPRPGPVERVQPGRRAPDRAHARPGDGDRLAAAPARCGSRSASAPGVGTIANALIVGPVLDLGIAAIPGGRRARRPARLRWRRRSPAPRSPPGCTSAPAGAPARATG